MNKRLLQTVGALVLAIAAGGAQAIPLSTLLGGGTITAGDKVFDQWRLISEANSDFLAPPIDASSIDVTALNDGGLDPGPGLHFTINNGIFDVTGTGPDPLLDFAYVDYMFGFRVTAAPGYLIKDNTLTITNALVTNSGDNGIGIQEFVGTDPSLVDVPGNISLPDLAVKSVEFSWLDPGPTVSNLTDSANFTPTNSIYVSKDILVWASTDGETASLTGFEQRFSQTVPEPGTLLLLAPAVVGLLAARRRNKAFTA